MSTETLSQPTEAEYSLLRLTSADGPVYRSVKRVPLRDARPDEVPLIDVSGMFSNSLVERQAVATQIHAAATTSGFFYVKNHGVPSSLIEAAHRSSLEFFRQPDEIKQKVNSSHSQWFNGWKPPQTQRINNAESIDVRETFSTRYNPVEDPAVTDVDAIPEDIKRFFRYEEFCWEKTSNLPHFKEDIVNYWRACLMFARSLLHTFALALSLPEDYFDQKTTHPDASIALNYYPSMTKTPTITAEEQVSIGSHTDFQFFTILWQDQSGGLQVLNHGGEWINASPIKDTFVVNIGDYLMRITNDRYISTVHRAKNYSGKERISMPFFFGFNLNETCGVLPSCVDDKHPAKYEPISCEEWVRRRFQATKVDSK
ncbi:MAG: hypothetical protein M1834_005426 [Cirrosporium novae-zelandiae]|nr:MAG: hypothetical protein M1834_005426 [Cirrosporium novae-zelandiae]